MGWVPDYLLVALFGVLVGASELVSRYRDAPLRAVGNKPASMYLGVNVLAALAALLLCRTFGLTLGARGADQQRALQVLVAGFGALAFFRTSLFVVRVGGKDVGVGPATLLQVLLFATDRAVDRNQSVYRAREVTRVLRGLAFAQVRDALPRYCLSLMQNVSSDEAAELDKEIDAIAKSRMDDALKTNALGLALMNVVGTKVLVAAAEAVRTRILEKGVQGEVYPRLREVVSDVKGRERTLDVLGLTLYTAWPNIRAWLGEEDGPLAGWTIRLRVIDPDVLATSGLFDPDWSEEARKVVADSEAYGRDNAARLKSLGVKLSVRPYSVMPAFHGFKLGDGTCFVSFLCWDDETGRVARPLQQYEYLPADDTSPRARHHRTLFDNWLRRIDAEVRA